jgi:hypothetical protein
MSGAAISSRNRFPLDVILVSLPAVLCAWHMLPNSCVCVPTIPQVTQAVDKIVGSTACRRALACEEKARRK